MESDTQRINKVIPIRIGDRSELDRRFQSILDQRLPPGGKVSVFIKRAVVEWGEGQSAPDQGAELAEQIRQLQNRMRDLERQLLQSGQKVISTAPTLSQDDSGEKETEAQKRVNDLMRSFRM
jgi:hypothetical protein